MADEAFINALTQAGSNIQMLQGQGLKDFMLEEHKKNKASMIAAGLKQ